MDNRKWEADAIASPPTAPVTPSDGYPTNGNPVAAQNATEPGAWWFHAMGEEIRAVIVEAGFTPNISTLTQLRDAIKSLVSGGDYKQSVRVASTAAINLAAPGASIDGVAMVVGDRFLEKDNATASARGIYIWNGAAVAATRATDADTGAEFNGGAIIPVEQGTVNADTNWQLTNDGTVTIGTTGLTFAQIAASTGGIKYSGVTGGITANITLTALAFNNVNYCDTASNINVTLPLVTAAPSGSSVTISNANSGIVTVLGQGGATIYAKGVRGATSIFLNYGESITLFTNGTTWIQAIGNSGNGSLAGNSSFGASTTLASWDVGKQLFYTGSTAGQTLTLPAANSMASGAGYWITNQATVAVTISRAGADTINQNTPSGVSNVTGFLLNPGESIFIGSNGSNSWNVFGTSYSIGIGQTWQDVKASRVSGTTYTNSTGKPIMVSVATTAGTATQLTVNVGGLDIASGNYNAAGAGGAPMITFIVPAGATYKATFTPATILYWSELR